MNQSVVIVERPSNALGIAGLAFSVLGWLTCGLLCIPGVIISALGLFSRPRAMAIAGLIIGAPGVLFFILAGAAMVAGAIGLNNEIERINADVKQRVETFDAQRVDSAAADQ